jgi:predicted nucleotidyltransferase
LLLAEKAALDELAAWLRERFADRLCELALFGSRARCEGNEESDLDVLVVVHDLTGAEGREIAQFRGDLLTKHDVLVSPFAVSAERMAELRCRERRIAREIDRDAVPL